MSSGLESDPFAQRDAARRMVRDTMRSRLAEDAAHHSAPDPAPQQTRATRRSPALVWMAGGGVLLATGAALLYMFARAPTPPAGMEAAAAVTLPAPAIPSADEAGVLAAPQDTLAIFRLAADPSVLVMAFPSLHEQALTLNRIGAFVEKAGMPRDRVMPDDELHDRISRIGESFDTFYYGHDYRAADLQQFFALAASENIALDSEERDLEKLLTKTGMLQPGATGAVISLPPQSAQVDAASRATILRHEVSHGLYFTDPSYETYTTDFWTRIMSEPERNAFRKMLGGEGYDTSNEDLVRNEMQAYLVHTTDRRFFNPATMGIDAPGLRAKFIAGMPAGWLRDETPQ